MRSVLSRFGVALLVSLPACAGAPPPPPEPPPAPAPPPVATVAAPAEPDLSPVAEPKNLVGVGRWRSVSTTISAVEKLAKLPVSLQSLVEKEVGDREVLDAMKLDSSIEIAAALDPASREPDLQFAFSLPLKSADTARAIAEREGKVSQVRPGVWRLGRTRGSTDVTCAIAISLGDAPARLVCGQRDRDLEALLPFMTRGLPTANLGTSDMHMELRFAPLQEKARPFLEQGGSRLPAMAALFVSRETGITDPTVLDLVGSIAEEGVRFGDELDTLVLDAALDAGTGTASSKGTLKLHGSKAWMSKALTGRADKQGPAPDLFWQMPKESDTASFGRGADPKLFEAFPKAISALFGAVVKDKLPDSDRKAIQDWIAKMPLMDAVAVSARGHIEGSSDKAAAPKSGKHTPAEAIKTSREQLVKLLGWTLVGYDTKADAVADWLREMVRVYNRPSLQAFFKKTMGSEASKLPVIRTAAVPGMPKGSLVIEAGINLTSKDVWDVARNRDEEWTRHPDGAPAKGFIGVSVVVVPDGNRTWVAFGGDPVILRDKIKSTLASAPKDGTLGARAGLDPLKSGAVLSGGFVSLASVTHSFSDLVKRTNSRREGKLFMAVEAAMPNKGQTPILVLGTAAGGATPSYSAEVRVQKGTIDDIAAAILAGIAQKMSRGGEEAGGVPTMMPPPPPAPPPAKPKKKLAVVKQYHELLRRILDDGGDRPDRTGTGTRAVFGHQMRFDLRAGFPLLTTKKLHLRSIIHELLWFLRGETHVASLQAEGVRIWDEWATPEQTARFGRSAGDLGPVYGHQWRNFGATLQPDGSYASDGVDQIRRLLDELSSNPNSRRLIVTGWNPREANQVALPPCHTMFQLYVQGGDLSCQLYQRSGDVFLGVPFNIASYALLTLMLAQVSGLRPGEFVHTLGDAHLYSNHLEQARLQLGRELRPLPTMRLDPSIVDLFAFRLEHFTLEGYDPHPHIKADVSV